VSLLLARLGGTTASQPWLLWPVSPRPPDLVDEPRQAAPSLHLYRTGFQTVGQPWSLPYWGSTREQQVPEQYDYRSARPDLHLYRQAFQTVGQPLVLWGWVPERGVDPEPYEGRSPAPTVHLWRVGYQTVGQPWFALQPPQAPRPEPEEAPTRRPVLYWQWSALVKAAPWSLLWWQSTRPPQEPEPAEARSASPWAAFLLTHVAPPPFLTVWTELELAINAGLRARSPIRWQYSSSIPFEGLVSVSPPSGAVVPQWTAVMLVGSLGPSLTPVTTTATVPNVVGGSVAAGTAAIGAAGLSAGEVVYVFSSQPFNQVIYQTPSAGSVVTIDYQVLMTASLGLPEPEATTVVP
jgi:hypothetical protein